MNWPVNEMPCDREECERTDTTPCIIRVYKADMSVSEVLFRYGLRQAWQFWWAGRIDVLDGYYCAKHAREEGFCWGCGEFIAGSSERFDFGIGGQWLCDNCWSNFGKEDGENWEEDYYPGPWDL